ncbi:MAG: hypothetical protein OJF61_000699 [Rhodanobacteraceae bacterium]|jgi:hypothetical protein|nr:MAG: hypothetical protein OJF61_000699 [Rhodanobacteraceae bacterium]
MKHALLAVAVVCLVLGACSNPKDATVPQDVSKIQSLKPVMEKLTPEDRDLAAGYIARHTVGAALTGDAPSIPAGETLGQAIEEQRKFLAEQKAEEQRQAALKAALQAKRDAATNAMRDAVTVTLVSKKLKPDYGYSGILMDTNLVVTFGYKNNTSKDIAGVKGLISIRDLFGDKLSDFLVSNDDTIPAGKSITWTGSRSVRYAIGDNKDKKFADLDDSKYKVVWEPEVIVFSDGTKLQLPKESDD